MTTYTDKYQKKNNEFLATQALEYLTTQNGEYLISSRGTDYTNKYN